ncbi:MAG: short-chain dehydrogenase [Ignavibacteria bacterium]|nr:short-chain dehydrogenase [Ignavibacteria bacterium]
MNIKGQTVLVIGGWGLVGSAVCHRILEEQPKKVIITSLKKEETDDAVTQLRKEYPKLKKEMFQSWWGNIFVRNAFKDLPREEILSNEKYRRTLIDDILNEMTSTVLEQSSVYQLLKKFKPSIVVDCVNSATGIAYQDIFQSSRDVLQALDKQNGNVKEKIERLLCTQYTPQLIRHVQLLYRSMQLLQTKIYVKIGTSGTGGMGLNIPYTHSEERPSRVLLSKSSVAGAHTMLLFLMGRTPDAPIIKEIKPTAAIAWKKISYGEIKKRGKVISLVDCPPKNGFQLKEIIKIRDEKIGIELNQPMKSVFIDTGENGLFSKNEFEAISTAGQMEYVTPEEIADAVVMEIKGGNTGHDIVNALDNAVLDPTYRAGFMWNSAIQKLEELEKKHNVESIAFEILGPPRLSKLLFEAYLLKKCFLSMRSVMKANANILSKQLSNEIAKNKSLRSQIISVGIPILMPDGKTLLRGKEIKIPAFLGENELKISSEKIATWSRDGWVDLRVANMEKWKSRMNIIIAEAEKISVEETSSRYFRRKSYWNDFNSIEPGKLAAWIFTVEEQGKRGKA